MHDTGIGRYCRISAVKERILNTIDNNPSASSGAVAHVLCVSHIVNTAENYTVKIRNVHKKRFKVKFLDIHKLKI